MTEQRTPDVHQRLSLRGIELVRAVSSRARAAVARWWIHLRRRQARRAAIRQLHSMDERLLRDIGVEPGQIDAVIESLLEAGSRNDRVVLPFARPPRRRASESAGRELEGSREKAA